MRGEMACLAGESTSIFPPGEKRDRISRYMVNVMLRFTGAHGTTLLASDEKGEPLGMLCFVPRKDW